LGEGVQGYRKPKTEGLWSHKWVRGDTKRLPECETEHAGIPCMDRGDASGKGTSLKVKNKKKRVPFNERKNRTAPVDRVRRIFPIKPPKEEIANKQKKGVRR